MAYESRDYAGGAPATTLNGAINNSVTSLTLADGTGYPTGSAGPFFLVIDPGLSTEEKVKATARSGTSVTGVTRGADDTSAASHSSGAVVQHVFTKTDASEANQHYANTALDHHTQYHNTSRHAAVSHVIGTHLPAPSTPTTVEIGTAAATGAATAAARGDHQHAFTGGLIALVQYRGGTGYTMNSTTLADIDATNLAVTFTAPANGKVLVKLNGNVEPENGGTPSQVYFGLRESSSTVTNSEQSVIQLDLDQGSSAHYRVTSAHYVTGLTAASAHTYKWAWRRGSGGGTIGLRSGSTDPLTMEVWAAP